MRFVIPDLDDPNAHSKAVRRAVGHRAAEVRQAWRDHNARIRPLLPPSLQLLQETPIDDGLIRSLRIDIMQRTFQLRLLCDDRQGYFDLDLDYKDIQFTPQETSMICLIAHAGGEVSRDEIDVEDGPGPPVFIHRISWHTAVRCMLQPEIELRFGGLEVTIARRADRELSRADDFITIVRDPDKIEGMDAVVIG